MVHLLHHVSRDLLHHVSRVTWLGASRALCSVLKISQRVTSVLKCRDNLFIFQFESAGVRIVRLKEREQIKTMGCLIWLDYPGQLRGWRPGAARDRAEARGRGPGHRQHPAPPRACAVSEEIVSSSGSYILIIMGSQTFICLQTCCCCYQVILPVKRRCQAVEAISWLSWITDSLSARNYVATKWSYHALHQLRWFTIVRLNLLARFAPLLRLVNSPPSSALF